MLSAKSWRLEEVLILAGLVWVLAALGLRTILVPSPTALPSVSTLVGTMLIVQLPTILLIHRFLRRHQTGWIPGFGFDKKSPPGLGAWILGSVAGCVLVLMALNYGLRALFQHFGWETGLQSAVLALQSGPTVVQVMIAFTAVVLAPVVEEPLFRGILYQSCRDAGFRWTGFAVTSLVFGVVHGNLPTLLPLSLFGAYQCWLYERTGNLLACILTHAGFNAVFVVLTLLGVAGS